ncbi:hypothetical protein HY988_06590 [Candidatus Micrarchaeota archaeon]|nr:hypothetical protein [Candidatus Micrarchaeota archaeon]
MRNLVEAIDRAAEARGVATWCAFREEKWGKEIDPNIFMKRDLEWCRTCDGAILIPQDSYGVRIELGLLTAFTKPILRLHEGKISHKTPFEEHLGLLATIFDHAFQSLGDVRRQVDEFISFLENIKS